MGSVVDVQVEGTVFGQHPVHLHDSHTEPAEEGAHIVPCGDPGCVNREPGRRPVVLYGINPVWMHIPVPCPPVLES